MRYKISNFTETIPFEYFLMAPYQTFEQLKIKMVKYCVYQERCWYEIDEKLKDLDLIESAKERIIEFLATEDYVNESRFVEVYARSKFHQNQWGKYKIRQHLKQKKITEGLIAQGLRSIDPDEYRTTVVKLFTQHLKDKTAISRHKTIQYLIGKGYAFEDIQESIRMLES